MFPVLASSPRLNHLLAALPEAEWQRWQPQLEWVDMPLGQVLYESGSVLGHVYFPTTAIVSLLYVTENGGSAEIAVLDRPGLERCTCECYAVGKTEYDRLLPTATAGV